jgi:hypothetical protein
MNELKILLFLSLNLSLVCSVFYPDNDGKYSFDIFVNKTSESVYNKQIHPRDRIV